MKWDLIYELRTDGERVVMMQRASADHPGYGFSATPHLLGSEQWWAAIDSGSIERRTLEGTITEAHPTEFGVQPEFRMLIDDGSELTGTRHGDETRYVEGLRVRMEFVTVERERDAPSELGTTADIVIAVWIEHSHLRTPLRPHGFYPSPPSPI